GFVPAGGEQGYGSLFAFTAFNARHDDKGGIQFKSPTDPLVYKPNEGKNRVARRTACKPGATSDKPCESVGGFHGAQATGVVVAMADGSGRFVTELVDPSNWVGMSTIAGGERVDSNF